MATKKRRVKRHNPNKRATRFFERATIWTFEAHRDVNGEQLHPQGMLKTARGDEELEKRKLDQIIDVGWIAQTYRSVSPEHEPDRLEAMMQFQLGGITEYRQQLWREVNEDVKEQREAA